jgi:plasmid stability protein
MLSMRYARIYGVEATPSERLAARAANRNASVPASEAEILTYLALGELRAATRLAATDFLALDFTRIAGDETRLAQR